MTLCEVYNFANFLVQMLQHPVTPPTDGAAGAVPKCTQHKGKGALQDEKAK